MYSDIHNKATKFNSDHFYGKQDAKMGQFRNWHGHDIIMKLFTYDFRAA